MVAFRVSWIETLAAFDAIAVDAVTRDLADRVETQLLSHYAREETANRVLLPRCVDDVIDSRAVLGAQKTYDKFSLALSGFERECGNIMRFDIDNAAGAALQLSANDYRASGGNCVHLEHRLSNVESNRGNLFHGWLLPCGS